MAATAGICTTPKICKTARSGRIVAIPLGEAFACPDCGGRLSAPAQFTPLPEATKMPQALPVALAGAGICMLGGALFLGHQLAGGGAVTPARTVVAAPPVKLASAVSPPRAAQILPAANPAPASQTATPVAPPAPPALQLGSLPPQPPPAPLPAAPLINAQPAGVMAATLPPAMRPPAPPDQPFSPVALAGGAPAYPAELAADGRPGRVAVTCTIQEDGAPAACRASARSSGPAFAGAALAWLNHGHVRFRPVVLHGHAVAGIRSWVLTIEEPPAALAEARRKAEAAAKPPESAVAEVPPPVTAAPLPPPVPMEQPKVQQASARTLLPAEAKPVVAPARETAFSTRVISGGTPPFPVAYDENRPGAVTVSCTIDTHGRPNGCDVVHHAGGSLFATSVEGWLRSGKVRFKPVTVNGEPVERRETWTVVFNQVPSETE